MHKIGDMPVLVTARTNRGREFISIYQRCERPGPLPSSAGDAPRAAPAASLPLKRGFYVASDTPCGQASNGTLSLLQRNGMNVSSPAGPAISRRSSNADLHAIG